MVSREGGEYGDDDRMRTKSWWLCDVWSGSSIMMMQDPLSSSWRTKGRASLLHAARIIIIAALFFVILDICSSHRSIIRPVFVLESRDGSAGLLQLREPQESPASGSTVATITAGPRGVIPTVLNEKRMTLQQDLFSARKDIQTATPADADPSLYPSMYLNMGTFSKSYRLMMEKFRIYVYQEVGRDAGVVHVGPMTGQNCVEGRFIRNMMKRDSSPFIVQDPEEAHMFYLPYSMDLMRIKLWDKSASSDDNMGTLIKFVNDYVEEVATKHPFWNLTRGTDHFMLACTDWGPHSVRGQQDLRANVVKAVCNADVNEEFVLGKDVSVPVLRLGPPRPYALELGGPPPSERKYLAFFAGGKHGPVRQALLSKWVGKDPDMKIFMTKQIAGNLSYVEYMRRSKYCICPAGWFKYTPRTTESIYHDCVPVIIADGLVPPFSDVLDWTKFSIIVPESDIPNLKAILLAIPESQYLALQGALSKVRQHFVWNDPPVEYDAFHMILHGLWTARLNQLAML